ncbi:MAG: VWA domain-containing protein [Polyangia bacterium]
MSGLAGLLLASPGYGGPPERDKDRDRETKPEAVRPSYNFSGDFVSPGRMAPPKMRMAAPAPLAAPPSGGMGATPGGAQDISYARDRIKAGEVPHPATFTPEGLFSEHDLPLATGRPCHQTLCLEAAATTVDLPTLPEARWLAQLGFASNLDAKTWQREAVNLVAVIDKSGSMSGAPIDTVKASLHQIIDQLGPGDQLSIVLYGDRAHVHLGATPLRGAAGQGNGQGKGQSNGQSNDKADRRALHAAVDQIAIAGSTAMEEGLAVGYKLAAETARGFRGRTRMMLFTDERPNVGATDAHSFMGMARAASKQGIGLTTVGVGVQFGAELATAISSVRGGNLFYFADVPEMVDKFKKDFDTMLTELAFDLRLKVWPQKGMKLVGLFGLPGDLVKRTPDGGLEMTVETIFLSKERGGIYFALAPEGGGALPPDAAAGPLALASVSYVDKDSRPFQDSVPFALWPKEKGALPLGLARGRLLVEEVTTLKRAAELHLTKNDQEGAYRLVHGLRRRLETSAGLGLDKELETVARLDATLTKLSGHQGEATAALRRDTVTGLPR